MFTLLSDFYHYYTSREEYAILILGLDGAGKSTLLESLKHAFPVPSAGGSSAGDRSALSSRLSRIRPTIGQSIGRLSLGDTPFVVWDLGGGSTLRDLWRRYYAESHVVIYVMDASTGTRLRESCEVLEELARDLATTTTTTMQEDARDGAGGVQVPILICANKQDVEGALSIADLKVHLSTLVSTLDPTEGGVLGCSALRGTGLDEVAAWVRTRALRNRESRPPRYR
ncbi:Putative uncharacterized protein [Taphrina deformans PYCC 5710]|uniref:ADP-ribosylation factor family protein n=1 Tax=Taphrina deformans (strain PYCC 5710 / ATCC 11124 / CBS 356.35 / IMI 108563 / JCM 9778 / NBRC 8474) TaxID=1097556 RepID=R4X8E5_TAPDE|nr:Putative uncharacterized protein [Taphrina deformans PYCC 5710]|eukprot:CCG81859.1 Putative uncharacterized protein [Taphrina deformans PYCC 5710]